MTASSAGDRAGLARPAPGDGGAGLPAAAAPPPNGPPALLAALGQRAPIVPPRRCTPRPRPGRAEAGEVWASRNARARPRARAARRAGVPGDRGLGALLWRGEYRTDAEGEDSSVCQRSSAKNKATLRHTNVITLRM